MAVHAIGFQVGAAMLGAAALPSLSGMLAQHFGLETIARAAVVMAFLVIMLNESVLARGRSTTQPH
jgi:fucose permease